MNKIIYYALLCLIIAGILPYTSFASTTDTLKFKYIDETPLIDGRPDSFTEGLKEFNFGEIETSSEKLNIPGASYKAAYNNNFLYLLIKIKSDSVLFRDRAYQNGDGFHLVIAMPKPGNADTDEFYVLRFSPAVAANNYPGLNAVWYYNIDLSGKRLSSAQMKTNSSGGITYYELLLPWSEIPPYTPFIKEGIGFNLCFVKAAGQKDKIYYYSLYDKKIQWEQNKRKYLNVEFEQPNTQKVLSDFIPDKRTLNEGADLSGALAVYSPRDTALDFIGAISTADNYSLSNTMIKLDVKKSFNRIPVSIPAAELVEGDYNLKWKLGNGDVKIIPVTILPEFNQEKISANLNKNENAISYGTRNTIIYRGNEIKDMLAGLKYYETAGQIREKIIKLNRDVDVIKSGTDPYPERRGIFRRAYLSKVDGRYIPYSIKIPKGYDRSKKYPLLVVLHGSGQLDVGMLQNADFGKGKFIEIAPSGRGTSNCFSADNAQDDISECIKDVSENYNINDKKILLAGFSMGGYGVFRTYYETPGKFAALAVFSGHPNLANKWLGGEHPDFTDAETLKAFKNVPIFIYHDKIDLNCPYDVMEGTVKKLVSEGAEVKFVTSSGMGHNILNNSNSEAYYGWLDKILKK